VGGFSFIPLGVKMDQGPQHFIHNENILLYRKLIAKSEQDPSRDEGRHKMLLALLAAEIAKEVAGL
jgi:hypothetical protein